MKQFLHTVLFCRPLFLHRILRSFRTWNNIGKRRIFILLVVSSVATSILLMVLTWINSFVDPNEFIRALQMRNDKTNLQQAQEVVSTKISSSDSIHLERQRTRKQRVLNVCKKLNATGQLLLADKNLDPSPFRSIFVDNERRILYCSVPKVACSNWRRVLLMLTGKMNTTNISALHSDDVHGSLERTYLKSLENYTMDEINERINTYYKFMFVRDPFERILSAYINKFVSKSNHKYKMWFGRLIVRRYRANPTNESLERGHDVTFEEFVAYLLDPRTTRGRPFNSHWRHYHELCHPCFIQYDFIGKYETFQEDADFVLKQLGVQNIVSFPPYERRVKTVDAVDMVFSRVPAVYIERLWKLFSIDFDMFDYPFPRFDGNKSHIIQNANNGSLSEYIL